eukprot:362169-Chlamydomonas_euryale.AAC.2
MLLHRLAGTPSHCRTCTRPHFHTVTPSHRRAVADHMKYTQPTAYAVSTMVLGAVLYEEEFRMSGVFDDVMLNVLWGAEWLAKAHVNASDVGEDNVLVAQVWEGFGV